MRREGLFRNRLEGFCVQLYGQVLPDLLFCIGILTPSRFRVKHCFRLVAPLPSETGDLRASRWFSLTSPIASLNMHTLRCRQEKELKELKVWTEENRALSPEYGAAGVNRAFLRL